MQVYAVEKSPEAAQWAELNVQRLGLAGRVQVAATYLTAVLTICPVSLYQSWLKDCLLEQQKGQFHRAWSEHLDQARMLFCQQVTSHGNVAL